MILKSLPRALIYDNNTKQVPCAHQGGRFLEQSPYVTRSNYEPHSISSHVHQRSNT
jgi:hypothetical protein